MDHAYKEMHLSELLQLAMDNMLGGKTPASVYDWERIFNFVAYNVPIGEEVRIALLFNRTYDTPISDEGVSRIANAQWASKLNTNYESN